MKDITAERIKERRIWLRLTQQELCDKIGFVNRSSITKIEKNAQGLPLDKLQQIAKALECSPSFLMGWTDDPNEQFDDNVKMVVDANKLDRAFRLPDKPRTEREALLDALNIELVIMDESRLKRLQKYAELINRGDL